MPKPPKDVTAAELAVLRVLWESGPATIRDITDVVYPDDPVTQYSTVKRLLARMRAKGIVASDTSGFAHIFRATVERDELVGRRLAKLAGDLCDGSPAPLLMHLLSNADYTPAERDQLNVLFEQMMASQERAPRGKRRNQS